MWRTVMRLEWRVLRRDRAAQAVLVVFALLLILAALAGGQHADRHQEGVDRAVAGEQARYDGHRATIARLGDGAAQSRDPRDPVFMGRDGAARVAVLPPAPLASVAVGQRDLHPQAVRITTDVLLAEERETETPMIGPGQRTLGGFDPAFLFVVLFPLVVIALSYELLSGERERGTLAMLLSQPISQRGLVLGKAAARALGLSAVTLAAALIGLWGSGADVIGGWVAALLYGGVLIAWALFWFAAAIAVDSRGGSSARNALVLIGAWLVLVIIVPGLLGAAVDTFYPAPDRVELVHEAREAAREIERELTGLEGRHDRDTSAADYTKKVVAVQAALAERTEPVLAEMRSKVRERQAVLDVLRFVSPAIVVQMALEDIAGSGAERQQRFEDQVNAFHTAWRTHFKAHIDAGARLSGADLDALPRFTFVEAPEGERVARVGVGIAALLLAAGGLLLLALPGLRRIGRLSA